MISCHVLADRYVHTPRERSDVACSIHDLGVYTLGQELYKHYNPDSREGIQYLRLYFIAALLGSG